MKSINATLGLAGFALLSLLSCKATFAQQPPDNVEGNWTIYSTNIDNGETVVKHVQIQQYGNRITGYFEGPNQTGPIQGVVNIHHIMFSTVTRNVLTFRGQIYGDNMSGLYGLHGRHAEWQAQRIPPLAQATPPPPVSNYQPELIPPSAPPAAAPVAQAAPQPATDSPAQDSSAPAPAPLSPDQLNALVAPIALYPDALVAQVLAASANPDQVAYADDWLKQNNSLTGTALAQAVDQQSWDPSVKALTQFPTVLDTLARNLSWTSSLGEAFANQQADVMAAVQVMRAKAQAAGTLQSSPQVTVVQQSPSTIVIQPANPQVVYIPQYNPAVVYGAPVVVPYYAQPPLAVASVGISFGAGIAIGATIGGGWGGGWGGGYGWGWHAWNVNWGGWGGWGGGGGGTVIYNHNTYINNRTWNHTNYNGYHPWGPGHPGYNPNGQPNGGHNGDHGLIGGNGGVQKPDGHFAPGEQPNGGHNGDHGLIGGNGGVQRAGGSPAPGTRPDGGHNGDHGLIGGNGGTQRPATRASGEDHARPGMSGHGPSARAASSRGHASVHRAPQHRPVQHHAAPHRSGGGGRRR